MANKTMGFLWRSLALAPTCRHTKEVFKQNIGSPSAQVCSTYLESLSHTSDSCGGQLLGGPAVDRGMQVASATCWT